MYDICTKPSMLRYLLIVAATLLLVSCAQLKEPEFKRIDKFRLSGVSLTSATIKLNVVYHNPNSFSMAVKETGADVYLDGIYVGKFQQDTLIDVGRNQEFSIPISGSVGLDKLLQLDLRNIGQREIKVAAQGSTKVGKGGIYITKPFSYEGMHRVGDVQF